MFETASKGIIGCRKHQRLFQNRYQLVIEYQLRLPACLQTLYVVYIHVICMQSLLLSSKFCCDNIWCSSTPTHAWLYLHPKINLSEDNIFPSKTLNLNISPFLMCILVRYYHILMFLLLGLTYIDTFHFIWMQYI